MSVSVMPRRCLAIALFTLALPTAVIAQQITYYDFDIPQANPSQVSYYCNQVSEAVAPTQGSTLFCFNDGTGAAANPSFILDQYPASIDPNGGSGSAHYATQMNPDSGNQDSTMWFSVPQRVTSGFTSWFAFKLTPVANGQADGIAFVIQNASGGGADSGGCAATGYGASVYGGAGGCMGYGGVDNSLALEFDTYDNSDFGDPNANHIALQSCGLSDGVGLPNSPNHTNCNVSLLDANGNPVSTLITNPTTSTANPVAVNLADGNVHQAVVIYNGPNDSPANYMYVYLDPPYVAGTHTPDPTQGAVPIFQGTYDITTSISPFISSGTANDSAYVGFTSGTGYFSEQQEVMAWTFTAHTSVSQIQPLNTPGTPTIFNFGSYNFAVTYPVGGPSVSDISMIITANTISPANFSALIATGPSQFTGTQCQVYDDTGGNCIIFSASCVYTDTNAPVACPNTLNTSLFIDVSQGYDNTIQPISPGLLQGDPLYTPIASITGDGSTATVTCGTPLVPGGTPYGECSVTPGQTVTILGAQPAGFNGTVTVAATPATNTFTFASTVSGATTTGGYLTSNNVQNIFTSYTPQTIDASSAGKTKSFSDFVDTAITVVPSQTSLGAATTTPIVGSTDLITATITGLSSQVPGPGSMPTGTTPPIAPSTVNFFTGPSSSLTPIANCTGVLVTATSATTGTAPCPYATTAVGPVTITAQYSDAYHTPSSSTLNLNVQPTFDAAIKLTFGSTSLTYPGTTTETVCITPATSSAATGTVKLYDGTNLLTTLTLSNGCAKWNISPPLGVGVHSMTAAYSGDSNNPAGVSAPTIVTVKVASTLMVPVCGPPSVPYGSSYQCAVGVFYNLGFATGNITYSLDGGAPVSVPLSNIGIAAFVLSKPALGAHHIVLNYAAQGNFGAAGPITIPFTVVVAPVSVGLKASTTSTNSGSPVTFTATVTSSSAGAPSTGTVSFYNGSKLLVTNAVNASGVATYTTTTLPVGSNTIKATYNGSTDYGTGTSSSVTVTIKK